MEMAAEGEIGIASAVPESIGGGAINKLPVDHRPDNFTLL
jgi:hypothetical protein